MKEVCIKIKYYEYDELSSASKEKVKTDYVNQDTRSEDFSDSTNDYLKILFHNSELKVQYSLNGCQGDGVNVYGALDLKDTLDKLKLTKNQRETFEQILKDYTSTYNMEYNYRYNYCIADRQDYMSDLFIAIDNAKDKGISKRENKLLDKINKQLKEYFSNLCGEIEKDGYNYFDPSSVTDDEMKELSKMNDWFYLEDGTLA